VLSIIFSGFFYLIIRSLFNFKETYYIVITNDKIYIYYYTKEGGAEKLFPVKISSIKTAFFRKRVFDGRNKGTIDIKTDERGGESYTIKFVPEILKLQSIIESALYEFGMFKQRWTIKKNKLNLELPHSFEISPEKFDTIKKRFRLFNIICGVCLSIIFGIALLMIFGKALLIIIFFGIALLSCFAVPIFYQYLKYIMPMNKISSSKDDKLILESDKLIYSTSKTLRKIQLNEYISLNVILLSKYETKANIYGIQIKEVFNSKNYINFGPLDNEAEIYEYLFDYFINWKKEKDLLLTQEKLVKIIKK